MTIDKELEKILKKCEKLDKHEKDLLITAFLSEKFSKLILVGGAATSWYSKGSYRTLDADVIVIGNMEKLKKGLKKLDFEKNRVWHLEKANFALDTVSRTERPKRTRKYEIEEYSLEVASPEEVIINDLAGHKFWNIKDDFDRAKLVFETEKEELDFDFLKRRAEEEKVDDVLENLIS